MIENVDGILNRLGEKLKPIQVRKAESVSEPEPSHKGNPDPKQLAMEVVGLLDDGSISPDVQSVKTWSMSKGLADVSAQQFAETVVSAYFDDEDDESLEGDDDMSEFNEDDLDEDEDDLETGEDEDNDYDDEGDDDGEEGEALVKSGLEYLSSLSEGMIAIQKANAVIAETLTALLNKRNEDSAEVEILKSQLAGLALKPASDKTPTITTTPKQTAQTGHNVAEMKQLIMKGVMAGQLGVDDISVYEQTGKVSARVEQYLKGGN